MQNATETSSKYLASGNCTEGYATFRGPDSYRYDTCVSSPDKNFTCLALFLRMPDDDPSEPAVASVPEEISRKKQDIVETKNRTIEGVA